MLEDGMQGNLNLCSWFMSITTGSRINFLLFLLRLKLCFCINKENLFIALQLNNLTHGAQLPLSTLFPICILRLSHYLLLIKETMAFANTYYKEWRAVALFSMQSSVLITFSNLSWYPIHINPR